MWNAANYIHKISANNSLKCQWLVSKLCLPHTDRFFWTFHWKNRGFCHIISDNVMNTKATLNVSCLQVVVYYITSFTIKTNSGRALLTRKVKNCLFLNHFLHATLRKTKISEVTTTKHWTWLWNYCTFWQTHFVKHWLFCGFVEFIGLFIDYIDYVQTNHYFITNAKLLQRNQSKTNQKSIIQNGMDQQCNKN